MEFTQIWYPQVVSHQDLKCSFFMTVDPENAVELTVWKLPIFVKCRADPILIWAAAHLQVKRK